MRYITRSSKKAHDSPLTTGSVKKQAAFSLFSKTKADTGGDRLRTVVKSSGKNERKVKTTTTKAEGISSGVKVYVVTHKSSILKAPGPGRLLTCSRWHFHRAATPPAAGRSARKEK